MVNKEPAVWYHLIKKVSWIAEQESGYAKEISALRRGNSSITEHYAYPYVLPYATDFKSADQKTALLRVAAMLAEYRDIPTFDRGNGAGYRSFGSWCYHLSKHLAEGKQAVLNPDKPDVVGQRLAYLHTQSLEEAVLSIRRLLALANGLQNPPSLDKYNLAKTIIYWGNGLSPASQDNRRQVLRDYYSSFNYTLSQAEGNSSADDQ
ncbi:type I-E CRISPR-associated protein Cse2/CasB [Rothia sp. 11254D007CT]